MKRKHILKIALISFLIIFTSGISLAQQATVTVNQDSKISTLLSLKKELEKENKLGDGYTIQLYYGELSRANSIIRRYRGSFGAWPASLEYETPNYKVWVGDFASRIEADRALLEIKKKFDSAFILKPSK